MHLFRGGCKTGEFGNSNAGHEPMKLKWKLLFTNARSEEGATQLVQMTLTRITDLQGLATTLK